ncbi:MAG: hypothetical protein V2B14_03230 [bacterium]
MENQEKNMSVTSDERIQKLIEEAGNELIKIQPEIDYLEQCQKKLCLLKDQKFKLSSLIISLKSLLNLSDINKINDNNNNTVNVKNFVNNNAFLINNNNEELRKVFLPDQAISQVKNYLRIKNNLNYEIFKAVVFNSGIATTEKIKQYLVENKIKQPKTGKTFENVELKEISSRTNYLVRKKILFSVEPGCFRSVFGWCDVK